MILSMHANTAKVIWGRRSIPELTKNLWTYLVSRTGGAFWVSVPDPGG